MTDTIEGASELQQLATETIKKAPRASLCCLGLGLTGFACSTISIGAYYALGPNAYIPPEIINICSNPLCWATITLPPSLWVLNNYFRSAASYRRRAGQELTGAAKKDRLHRPKPPSLN